MDANNLFTPLGDTVSSTTQTTATAVALADIGHVAGKTVSVLMTGVSALGFIKFGPSAVTVTSATGMPVRPDQEYLVAVGPGVTHCAVVVATASAATFYFTSGV